MPASFVIALLFILLALGVLAFGKKIAASQEKREVRRNGYKTGEFEKIGPPLGWRPVILAVLTFLVSAGLLTANASFNTVPIRNVGIVTKFHTPTGSVTGSGVHWVAPYDEIEEWDANYELWDHRSDNDGKGMLVKIAGNQDAWVPVSVEYAPNPDNASKDFSDYARDRDNWISRRVYPTLDNLVSPLFRTHDPLAKANVDPVTGQVNPPDMTPYKDELNRKLQSAGAEFKIRNLYMGTMVYSPQTTQALQQYANLVLQNRNLEQEKKNQTLKNDITNKQAAVDPLTYCLQIQEKTGTLCLLAGKGSSPVIVDSTKK